MITCYRTVAFDNLNVFFGEAGSADAPALLLLHGFPTPSHMFRELMPALADRYHVVAPDLPGFGFSDAPDRTNFTFTRDIPDAEVHLLEAGHFALESQGREIAAIVRNFLARKLTQKSVPRKERLP
jgi:pimeloyl-ACP methyl ester carboxylesterase